MEKPLPLKENSNENARRNYYIDMRKYIMGTKYGRRSFILEENDELTIAVKLGRGSSRAERQKTFLHRLKNSDTMFALVNGHDYYVRLADFDCPEEGHWKILSAYECKVVARVSKANPRYGVLMKKKNRGSRYLIDRRVEKFHKVAPYISDLYYGELVINEMECNNNLRDKLDKERESSDEEEEEEWVTDIQPGELVLNERSVFEKELIFPHNEVKEDEKVMFTDKNDVSLGVAAALNKLSNVMASKLKRKRDNIEEESDEEEEWVESGNEVIDERKTDISLIIVPDDYGSSDELDREIREEKEEDINKVGVALEKLSNLGREDKLARLKRKRDNTEEDPEVIDVEEPATRDEFLANVFESIFARDEMKPLMEIIDEQQNYEQINHSITNEVGLGTDTFPEVFCNESFSVLTLQHPREESTRDWTQLKHIIAVHIPEPPCTYFPKILELNYKIYLDNFKGVISDKMEMCYTFYKNPILSHLLWLEMTRHCREKRGVFKNQRFRSICWDIGNKQYIILLK